MAAARNQATDQKSLGKLRCWTIAPFDLLAVFTPLVYLISNGILRLHHLVLPGLLATCILRNT